MENVGKARFLATNALIGKYVDSSSRVVEIGANDASFRNGHKVAGWITVDKYGNPDLQADLDGADVLLPFPDGTIDVVVCTEVLEHLRMGSPLVREFGRILKPEGALIVSVPNICSLKSRIKVLFGGVPNMAASGDCGNPLGGTGVLADGHWVAGHVVDFNLERLSGYLRRGELEIAEIAKMSITTSLPFWRRKISLPSWTLPATFGDFLLVVARPASV